jgi:enterochelin esterase-like enzyme
MDDEAQVSRRTVLAGAGALALGLVGAGALAEHDVLPGRVTLHRLLRLNGPNGQAPRIATGAVLNGSFVSVARRGARTNWRLVYPPGHTPGAQLGLLVVLHGRGDDSMCVTHGLALDRYLAAAVMAGVPPFAIVAVDGSDRYWHARKAGDDSGAMVTDELLPLMADRGLRTERPAYLGYSMGGYGVLLLAERQGPGKVGAVVAESPALWHHASDTPSGAFDDAADFAAHDVITARAKLTGIPLRIDCGEGDPFYPVTRDLVHELNPRPAGGFQAGAHTKGYWRRMAPAQLRFVGTHLAAT